MSLILEALNRARREQHNAVPVPGVDSEHYFPAVASQNPWQQRGLLLVLALSLLVIGVLLGREFSRAPSELPAAAMDSHTVLVQAPLPNADVPASMPAPEPALDEAPVSDGTPLPGEEAAPIAAPAVPDSAVQLTVPATIGIGLSAEVAALYEQSTAPETIPETLPRAVPAPAREQAVDIANLVSAAEQALEDVRLTEHSAPFLGDLSQQRKDAVPTLMYLQHDYRSTGGSTVTINSQQAGAGQTVGRGVRVEEVLPDSVVLSHDGQQFRLRALNSWVNL